MLRDAAKRFLADNCSTKFVRQVNGRRDRFMTRVSAEAGGSGMAGALIRAITGGANGTPRYDP